LIYQYYSPDGLKENKQVTNSSRLILKEAEKYGISWKIIPGTQIITLKYKKQERSYHHQIPSSTSLLAHYCCSHKKTTSNLLKQAGINVPKGYRVRRKHQQEELKAIFESLKKPLAIKPSDGTWGDNISLNISDYQDYLKAVDLALSYSLKKNTGAIVEEMFEGEEYRILVSREKVIGVLKRIPANVIGNSQDNIEKLIKEKNKEEIRGIKGDDKSHNKIIINKRLKNYLEKQNLSLESIPQKNERIYLRKVSNISQGGDAIDFTDQIHPSVEKIAIKAINTIPGLSFAGIDFMTKDITKEQDDNSYVIIEINDSPGFDIHDYPYQGKNRHAAREFLFLIFPELKKDLAKKI
jgi:D-alanine-D-alanine ligase-like ATP-grasp enzyme